MSTDMKLIMERFNKAMTSETLTEQKSPLINALLGGEEEEEKPSTPQAPTKNTGVSDFLLKQVAGLKAKGYKEAPGFAAAGIKAGKTYMHDGSYYSGYVVTFKFKGVPGEFVALTESGIRGHANLYGPWNAEPGEVSNWQNSVAGKSLAIGERRPGITDEDYTDEDLISVVIAKTPLLYKK